MSQETHLLSLDDAAAAARWQALWDASPQRCAFATTAYARALAEARGQEAQVLLVSEGGVDEAGVLLFVRRRGPYRTVEVPPLTAYTSLLFRTFPPAAALHARTSVFDAALQALARHFDAVALHLHPSIVDVRTVRWCGWDARPLYTYHLALDAAQDPVQTWSASARRTFRLGRDLYRLEEPPDAPRPLLHLLQHSYARQQRALPFPPQTFSALLSRLQKAERLRIFTLTPQAGEGPEAAVALLHDGKTAHYWLAGSLPGPAMTVLLGLLWQRLRDEGFRLFDFVGANTPSIAEFKRRFGPALTPYYRIEHQGTALLRLLNSWRRL